MAYRAPVEELAFQLAHVVGADRLAGTERFAEAGAETIAAVLGEAGRVAEGLAPLNRAGDLHPARLENGVVRTSPGFAEGYRTIAEGGWVGLAADPVHGGMGLPVTLLTCVNEMLGAACLALQLCPLLSQGQIEALERHGSPVLRELFLPRLIAGDWTGTMNLTEPQAGSDVGAIRSRAEPAPDGTFRITGEKIYITWGDHDMADNVCHLVLARLPDAAPGTRGISLFLVPKRIPDEHGRPGVANTLRVVSLEHKMGLHGSPTAVMAYEEATGWLVGAPHGGMAAMFTMMNNARLGVGVQGVAVAELASQAALAFARERKQGRAADGAGGGAIIGHPDVRRMLLTMRALTAGARAICLDCAVSTDLHRATGEADWNARAAFLTPIAKAFGTDVGMEVAELGVQVHGGMGYIEETGVAQLYRDVRVTAIYEGTNGIQAADLVGRKLGDGGAAALALLAEVEETSARDGELGPALARAAATVAETTRWMVGAATADRLAGSTPYLRAFALVLGGHSLLRAALADPVRRPLARFHIRQLMPVEGLCAAARDGAEALFALDLAS